RVKCLDDLADAAQPVRAEMHDNGFLVREVLVDRADRDARSEGDASRRGPLDAVALDECDGGVQDGAEGSLGARLRRGTPHAEAPPLRPGGRARQLHWHAIRCSAWTL